MKPIKLVIFSATGGGLESASRAVQRIAAELPDRLTVQARTNSDLFDSKMVERFITEHVNSADAMIMIFHGGRDSCTYFDELVAAGTGRLLYLHPGDAEDIALSQQHSSAFGSDHFNEMMRYIQFGGTENWVNLFKSLLAQLTGEDVAYQPPQRMPTEALYHPDTGTAATLAEHLAQRGTSVQALKESGQPVIGLWFHRGYYQDDGLPLVNSIIREIERQGAFPLTCFYMRLPDHMLDNKISDWVIENYFQADGETIIHVLLNMLAFSITLSTPQVADVYVRLNVPVLQAVTLFTSYDNWYETHQGATPFDVAFSAAQPEFDGVLITVPVSTYEAQPPDPYTGAVLYTNQPIPERITKIVQLARKWAMLRLKPNHAKKIAIIFHNYPPRNDTVGCARGLDSFASVVNILRGLAAAGYCVEHNYATCDDLAHALLERVTNDRRWMTSDKLAARAVAQIPPDQYEPWHTALPEKSRTHMIENWGDIPGEVFVHNDHILVNGLINGHVYIGIQPPRGFVDQPENIHDPYLAPAHHYLFHYRWIRDVFGADAVLHIGKHGSLEWLPGKSFALSEACYPDLAIMDLPNIYPYIINDPGEGTQAKRRSYACIDDHLIPVMTNADQYEELAEIDARLLEYMQMEAVNPKQVPVIQKAIWEMTVKQNLHADLDITEEQAFADFDAFVHRLHSYLSEVADTAISDGLHILGEAPAGDMLAEFTTQLVRVKNGDVPSLRESIARAWSYDYDTLLDQRGAPDPTGRFPTNATALAEIHAASLDVVRAILADEEHDLLRTNGALNEVAAYIRETALPRLAQTTEELDAVMAALSGEHVLPGASGAPTRGMVDILPTRRNFFSVDPRKIPSETAWQTGVAMGDALVERYRAETGEPPDNIGMVVWSSPTMRTMGEDVAQALYLMGVRPVWEAHSGRVKGLEVLPTSELKFPRVDVTFRTSGLFRDTFPNLLELLDDAVLMAASLNEPVESNFLRRNVLLEVEELTRRGIDPNEALREATFRVFSDPPGTYGTGVPEMIDAKAWKTNDDIGNIFIDWGGYAYGKGIYGTASHQTFRRRLSDIRLVVKNEDSREYDMLSCDDFNAYHGGFIAAVKALTGQYPLGFTGDTADRDRLRYRSLQEEARHVFRSRILNPKWIEGLMRHGFKGAGDLSRTVDYAFHWDATIDIIDDWMYEGLAERYALDEKMQQWLKEVNPYALQNITERLLEAIAREMWEASPEMQERLENLYFDIEGDIEEITD
ncbi:MAG: cobaltochelatase subunit CobN [Chloroflexi bacterium]|nr:cobaltochelatase subunit CobN [Chloroflexota bacterium]